MKKVFVTVVLAVISVAGVHAQVLRGYAAGGFTISQIDGDEVYGFKHAGLNLAVGTMIPLNPTEPDQGFQLSMELQFNGRGALNTRRYDPFYYRADLYYVDVPFMIHYVDKRAGAALGVGVQYGRLIKSKEKWAFPVDTVIYMLDRPVVTEGVSFIKNDFAFVADFRFNIYKRLKFDVRWQYSLFPIREDFEFSNSFNPNDDNYKKWTRDFKSNWVTFRLMYIFNEEIDQPRHAKRRRSAY